MVVMGFKAGQLANRLFAFSHFIANAIEYRYTLLNPTFDEYQSYFASTSKNDFGIYRISTKFGKHYPFLKRVILALGRRRLTNSAIHSLFEFHDKRHVFDLQDGDFLKDATRKKIVIAHGWGFRDYINFKKHSELIKTFFGPVSPYKENVEILTEHCRKDCDILVGVHMRRGDYKDWKDGAHYYDDGIYYDKMLQVKHHLQASGKKVSFLLCSNEKIEPGNFAPLDVYPATNHFIEDLYSLSQCHYIIGPPSTYSLWASFYGNVPCLHINSPEQPVDVADFTINCG